MFEGIVSKILTKYLEEYIENFDANSLNIGVWNGDVNLKNLHLKNSALDSFNLPITVAKGYLGNFRLVIPWKSLRSEPVRAEIQDLFIVVKPKKCSVWDAKTENERAHKLKQQSLENYEILKQKKKKEKEKVKQEESKEDPGFIARLTETVVNNVQIKISNVHLRYEDDYDPQNPIVLGFTLQGLRAYSVGSDWKEKFIKTIEDKILKAAEMNKLAIYMENNVGQLFSTRDLSFEQFTKEMTDLINNENNRYILRPINGSLRLTMQPSGTLDLTRPKLDAIVNFEEVSLVLDNKQYKNLLQTLSYMTNYEKLEELRKLRPTVKPDTKEGRKAWWKYAVDASKLSTGKEFFSWNQVKQRMQDRKDYIQLYKRKKGVLWVEKLDEEGKKKLEELENRLSYEDIVFFRELCEAEIEIEREQNKQLVAIREEKIKSQRRWFSWGRKSHDEEPAVIELTPEQKAQLYRTVGYDAKEEIKKLSIPEDYVKTKITVQLQKGFIKLVDSKNDAAIVEAQYSGFVTSVKLKEKSQLVTVTLEDFNIYDRMSTKSIHKQIWRRKNKTLKPILSTTVETNPPSGTSDLRVSVAMEGAEIIVNVGLVQKILGFFVVPATEGVNLEVIENAAKKSITSIQQQAQLQLKMALETKKVIDLYLQIEAPKFIIPENCESIESNVVVLDLGQLVVKSDIDAAERKRRLQNAETKEDDYYDRFKLKMSQIQMMVMSYKELVSPDFKESPQNQLLEKVSFTLNLAQCIIPSNEQFTTTKLDGAIDSIKFNISPKKLEKVMRILNTVMVLADNPTGTTDDIQMRSFLEVKGPIHSNDEWKGYYTELRENAILLYETESSVRPLGRIDINSNNFEIKDAREVDDKKHVFMCILPQADGSNYTFYFAAEDLDTKLKWLGAIRGALVSLSKLRLISQSNEIGDVTPIASQETQSEQTQTEKSPTKTILSANFTLESLVVTLARNKDSLEEEVSEVKFSNLTLGATYRNFDISVNMELHAMEISDLLTKGSNKYIVKSSSEKELALAQLSYIQAKEQSKLRNLDAEQVIDLKFQQLQLYFDPVALSNLVTLGYQLMDSMGSLKKRQAYFQCTEPSFEEQAKKKLKENESATIKLLASMESVSLILIDYGSTFASLSMSKTNVEFLTGPDGMKVGGDVGNLVLKDHSDDTSYPEILGLNSREGSLIRFEYKQDPPMEQTVNEPRYTKEVIVNMESVKFVYLQRLIKKLQAYFMSGPLMDALKTGGKKAAQYSIEAVKKQSENIEMLRLKLKFVKPTIIIPAHYKSTDRLVANLGTINIENSLEEGEFKGMEKYSISLTKMNLRTHIKNNKIWILDDTAMNLSVKRAVLNPNMELSDLLLYLEVPDVSITLTQTQYQFIFRMLDDNFGDTGDIHQPNTEVATQTETKQDAPVEVDQKEREKVTSQKVRIVSQFKIVFPKLNLTLLNPSKFGRDVPLAQLIMQDLSVIYQEKSDKTTMATVKLKRINAFDNRPHSKSLFKEFISCNNKNNQEFIDFTFEKYTNGDMIMNINMGDPRIAFVPDVVTDIQEFFTNMRPTKKKHQHKINTAMIPSQPVLVGDITISNNTWLGDDMYLNPQRKLYIAKNDSGTVVIDGEGNKIEFMFDEKNPTPLLYVEEGMTLKLKNITLKAPELDFNVDFDKLVHLGKNAQIIAPATQGVIRHDKKTVIPIKKMDKKDAQIEEQQQGRMAISGTFGQPSIVFPESATDPKSRLAVFQLGMNLTYERTNLREFGAFEIKDLKAFVEQEGSEVQGVAIIEPISLKADYSSVFTPVEQGKEQTLELKSNEQILPKRERTVKVHIDKEIKIRISYQDVQFVMKIMDQFSKPKQEEEESKDEELKPIVEIEETEEGSDQDTSEMSGSDSDEFEDVEDESEDEFVDAETESDETSTTITETVDEKPITEEQEYNIHFETNMLSILLVDDIRGYDIPLLDFKILKLNLEAPINIKQQMTVKASLGFCIAANYYNMIIAEWEPIIELWGCAIEFSRGPSGNPKVPYTTTLRITKNESTELDNQLCINVTQSMIETVMTTSKLWSEGFKGKAVVSKKFQPFCLRNHYGTPIKFWKKNEKEHVTTIEPGKLLNFDFPENYNRTDSASVNKELIVCIQLPTGKPHEIDVRRVGKTKLVNETKATVCFIEIDLVEGRKIITVRSGLKIVNKTTETWSLRAILPDDKHVEFGVVKPGESFGIPSTVIEKGTLSIKPTEHSEQYKWSQAQIGFKITEIMKNPNASRIFTCNSTNILEEAQAYYAVLNVKIDNPNEMLEKKNMSEKELFMLQVCDFTFELRPPLAIENLLGCPLEFNLYDKTTPQAAKMEILKGVLKRGEKLYVYTANLRNFIQMRAQLPGNDWFSMKQATIYNKGQSELPLTSQIVINDKHNRNLYLYFDYSHNTGLAYREVFVYCPYWIINHTSKKLIVKENVELAAGQDLSDESNKYPLMFAFRGSTKKISVAVDDSEFSRPFSIDNPGNVGNLELKSKTNLYNIGLGISLAPGKFKRTKVVTFTSRYVLINRTQTKISYKQHLSKKIQTIEPNKRINFFWPERDIKNPMLCIKLTDSDYEWSAPFRVDVIGTTFTKLLHKDQKNAPYILNVNVKEQYATLFIIIEKYEQPPYKIDNRTDMDVKISQLNVNTWWTIPKQSEQDYAFDDTNGKHALIVQIPRQTFTFTEKVNIDKVSNEKQITMKDGTVIYMSVLAEGPTRVLRISTKDEKQIKKSSEDLRETLEFLFFASIDSIGISLINNEPMEIAFISIEKLNLSYTTTDKNQYIEAQLGHLQMDNQFPDAPFPVLITDANKDVKKPFIHVSITKSLKYKTINYFKYFSVSMQAAKLAVDYGFIKTFSHYISTLMVSSEEEDQTAADLLLKDIDEPSPEPKDSMKYYFEKLELHPIKITVTFRFSRTEREEIQKNPILLFLDGLGVTLVNIDEAPLKLNALILQHPFLSSNDLIDRIKKHYTRAATTEFYKIIGSMDIIGNPVGLFNDIGTGVKDFFYEPATAIIHSPEDITKSIAKGSLSLFTNTMHGTFNTASKVTGSFGKGLSYLTFDDDYIRERQRVQSTKPKDIKEGVLEGAEAFAKSVFDGATGLFVKPVEGYTEEGALGLVKGFGKGLIGIPMKPMAGLFDFATKTTEGFSNVKNYFEQENKGRKRFPRVLSKNKAVIPYDPVTAYAQYLLNTIGGGKYKDQEHLFYCENEGKTLILLTNKSIFCIKLSSKNIEWKVDLDKIQSIALDNKGAILIICEPEQQKSFLFGSKAVTRKIVNSNAALMRDLLAKLQDAHKKVSKK